MLPNKLFGTETLLVLQFMAVPHLEHPSINALVTVHLRPR